MTIYRGDHSRLITNHFVYHAYTIPLFPNNCNEKTHANLLKIFFVLLVKKRPLILLDFFVSVLYLVRQLFTFLYRTVFSSLYNKRH